VRRSVLLKLCSARRRISSERTAFVTEADPLVAAGREQGEIIAGYLIRRMQEGSVTPVEAVNVVAALIQKQAEEMVSSGKSQEEILRWFEGLRETVMERLSPFAQQN
jgi:hypothetical protein